MLKDFLWIAFIVGYIPIANMILRKLYALANPRWRYKSKVKIVYGE